MAVAKRSQIDRRSPVPVYYQIETDLKERIMNREWEINEQLPSEEELSKQYGVSRLTLRQALSQLEKDNIIIKHRGKGTFINADPTPIITELNYSLVSSDNFSSLGHVVTAEILEQKLVTDLHPAVSEHLGISKNDKAVYLKRLLLRDGHPIAICRVYINEKYAPGLENKPLINNSISQSLKHYYQFGADYVEDSMETIRVPQSDLDLLKCKHDTSMILVTGVSYLKNREPLEYSTTVWNGDIVRFHLTLQRNPNTNGFTGVL